MTPALMVCLWFALEPWGRRRMKFFCALWLLHVLAALGYWIGVDLPRARDLDHRWPIARSLADQITADRDRVVIDDRLADLGMLLEIRLDRRVKERSRDASIPTSVQWLIVPIEREPPPGFVPRSSCGGCELLHRG